MKIRYQKNYRIWETMTENIKLYMHLGDKEEELKMSLLKYKSIGV